MANFKPTLLIAKKKAANRIKSIEPKDFLPGYSDEVMKCLPKKAHSEIQRIFADIIMQVSPQDRKDSLDLILRGNSLLLPRQVNSILKEVRKSLSNIQQK